MHFLIVNKICTENNAFLSQNTFSCQKLGVASLNTLSSSLANVYRFCDRTRSVEKRHRTTKNLVNLCVRCIWPLIERFKARSIPNTQQAKFPPSFHS